MAVPVRLPSEQAGSSHPDPDNAARTPAEELKVTSDVLAGGPVELSASR